MPNPWGGNPWGSGPGWGTTNYQGGYNQNPWSNISSTNSYVSAPPPGQPPNYSNPTSDALQAPGQPSQWATQNPGGPFSHGPAPTRPYLSNVNELNASLGKEAGQGSYGGFGAPPGALDVYGQGGLSNAGNGIDLTMLNRQLPTHTDAERQLFSPDQLEAGDWLFGQLNTFGPFQPYMNQANQFAAPQFAGMDPSTGMMDFIQRNLDAYRNVMGSQQSQANRGAYLNMLGDQQYGGIARTPPGNRFEGARNVMNPGDPWGSLNSMGIYSSAPMRTWHDLYTPSAEFTNPEGMVSPWGAGEFVDPTNPLLPGSHSFDPITNLMVRR